ncbi:hypothetical protein Taro_056629 [Colocasia esculenta]|uniref:Uncharacterized protein n=1 Tax=Colocasia esculenta TaxID=4460 RepID=A0A843XWR7_COLES|nr:hypothetical protein [Colocasia esculenta]
MKNWSTSVDTSSGSVDTRDNSQKTFWPIWDSVSTLVQVVSTLETTPRTFWCVDTSSSSVDTRDLPRTPFGLFWDSVSTLDQVWPTLARHQDDGLCRLQQTNEEEDELLVVDPQLPSHQELLHTAPASFKTHS